MKLESANRNNFYIVVCNSDNSAYNYSGLLEILTQYRFSQRDIVLQRLVARLCIETFYLRSTNETRQTSEDKRSHAQEYVLDLEEVEHNVPLFGLSGPSSCNSV